jgi:hypothetical protein
MSSDDNPSLLDEVLKELFGASGQTLLNPDNESKCLEGYYQNPYDFTTWNKPGSDVETYLNKNSDIEPKRVYRFNRFVEEVKYIINPLLKNLDKGFKIHDNPPLTVNNVHKNANHSDNPSLDNYSYTIRDNSYWFTSLQKEDRFGKFKPNEGNFSGSSETLFLLHNLSREVPIVEDRLKEWIGDGASSDGFLKEAIDKYSEFILEYDEFEKKCEDFLGVSMYNSQEVKFSPDIRAFFTSYVSEDIGFQLQEIRTTDGRLFTRTFQNEEWSLWEIGSPDKTKTSSIELTSGDVGAVPLGNQGGAYKFNVDLEAMKPGEVLYCLTRDVTLSGLPESLRYGSVGYRNTPDSILESPVKRISPNSMGCYGLFDPQNDINEPDSNGIMEIMPSTELFSDEIPRPISEQQRGWLETKYDGIYYFQSWTPLSPSNINWCEEQDQPRYAYYRKGTLQISDSIYGSKSFVKWTKWHRKNNVETVVDWGEVTPETLSNMLQTKTVSTNGLFSILGMSDLYDQPVDTTYMWTIKDEGNKNYSSDVTRTLGYKIDGLDDIDIKLNTLTLDQIEDKDYLHSQVTEAERDDTSVPSWKKTVLSTQIVGIPSIQNEGGPPIKLISDPFCGPFKVGNETTPKRKSIFSRLTSVKTKDIVFYEWRDLGQIYKIRRDDKGFYYSIVEDLETETTNKKMFPDRTGLPPGLSDKLFSLKEKSSDFTYYREGRVVSKQDLNSLPDKVIKTYAIWTPWHSLDERLKSIESRINFIESLQGLAPASNYTYIPILSRSLSSKHGEPDTDSKDQSRNLLINLIKLNHAYNIKIGRTIIGEYSPMYYLRYGFNTMIGKYDSSRSFWGNWINFYHIGTVSGLNKEDFIFSSKKGVSGTYASQFNPEGLLRSSEEGALIDGEYGGILHDGSGFGVTFSNGKSHNDKSGQSYYLVHETINTLGMKAYQAASLIAPISLSILNGEMIIGLLGAALAPLLAVNAGITVTAVVAAVFLLDTRLPGEMGPSMTDVLSHAMSMWAPDFTPLYNGKFSLNFGVRRNMPNGDSKGIPSNSAVIDTSLWGWLSEIKRRTDVIKFIEAEINFALNVITHTIGIFNTNFIILIAAQMPVVPSSGVLPIPFLSIGMPGPGLTSLAYYSYALQYIPYMPGEYGFNDIYSGIGFDMKKPRGSESLRFSSNLIKGMFLERTYEDEAGIMAINNNETYLSPDIDTNWTTETLPPGYIEEIIDDIVNGGTGFVH